MNDRKVIALGAVVIVVVLASLALYLAAPDETGFGQMSVVIVLALVTFAAYMVWDKARNASRGLPVKDERLTRVNYRAGYHGFIAAIWSAVFAPMVYNSVTGLELEGHLVTAVVVIVSGLTFAVSYLFLARKGK
jgi:cobalamin synthase